MAVVALSTKDMVRADWSFLAVVTHDIDGAVAQLFGHRSVLNLRVQLAILLGHVAEAFEAERALVLVFRQLLEAFWVHWMPTVQEDRLVSALEHVLEADGAVLLDGVCNVFVLFFDLYWNARIALVAVEEVLPAASATDTAALAVEVLLMGVVVEDVAFFAEVLSEKDLAVLATLAHRLRHVAEVALDLLHWKAIKRAGFPLWLASYFRSLLATPRVDRVLSLQQDLLRADQIVTEPARVKLAALFTSLFTVGRIVLTLKFSFLFIEFWLWSNRVLLWRRLSWKTLLGVSVSAVGVGGGGAARSSWLACLCLGCVWWRGSSSSHLNHCGSCLWQKLLK
jgi:hypothetical protein